MRNEINKCVIPLAGLGIRMLPITKSQPKEMLPIYDRPAIHNVVLEAKESGIENFLFITGRGKEAIENYFDFSFELNERLKKKNYLLILEKINEIYNLGQIFYIRQKEPKGLGDAIYLSKNFVNDDPFVVILADDIFDYKEPPTKKLIEVFHKYNGIVLGVKKVPEDKGENYGIVKIEKIEENFFKVLDLIEKPKKEEAPSNYAIIGRYILLPEIFNVIPNLKGGYGNEIQLTDAIKMLLGKIPIYAYEIDEPHFDIGNKVDYIIANIYFALKDREIKEELIKNLKNFLKDL